MRCLVSNLKERKIVVCVKKGAEALVVKQISISDRYESSQPKSILFENPPRDQAQGRCDFFSRIRSLGNKNSDLKCKNPTREEVRRVLETDWQLGGGVSPVHIGRHWEEECAASMF
jgi:hypothetical protein